MLVTGGVGGRGNGVQVLNEGRVSFWGDQNVLEPGRGSNWLHTILNVLNATELFMLKWLMHVMQSFTLTPVKINKEHNL